ncbi:AMP-binding protein [Cupriavidus basilensis]
MLSHASRPRRRDVFPLRPHYPPDGSGSGRGRPGGSSGWKIVAGGARFPRAWPRGFETGIDAFAGYGMSETCPFVTAAHVDPSISDPDDSGKALTTRTLAGRALPLVDIQVVDEAMRVLPSGSQIPGKRYCAHHGSRRDTLANDQATEGTLARRLSAHWRYGYHRRRWLLAHYRPTERCDQDRR